MLHQQAVVHVVQVYLSSKLPREEKKVVIEIAVTEMDKSFKLM